MLVIAAALLPAVGLAQSADSDQALKNRATAQELPTVVVIGNSPLPGLGLPLQMVPGNVQSANSQEMRRQQSLDITDYLNNNFSGVNVNQSQDNPLQNDLNYHGFTASPLLGTPQGLSVYVDSVRVNESFGDTVNWDLIPQFAVSTITLIPGSNPLFGLNTLGGALSLQTKSGHDNPGTAVEGTVGSFGRTSLEASTGGSRGPFDWFLGGYLFDENGWRDLSPSHARQLFAKLGWQTEISDLDFSYTFTDNSLVGNGVTPQSMLDYRYESIYTAPDRTHNHLNFANLVGTQFLAENWLLSGNIYYRSLATNGLNGDVNDDNYLSEDYPGPAIDCSAAPGTLTDNAYCSNGINRSGQVTQKTAGLGLQITNTADLLDHRNQLIMGAEYSHASNSYAQRFQYGMLDASRNVVATDSASNPNGVVTSVGGRNDIWGAYATDTWSPTEIVHVTLSARYNHNHETLNGYSVNTDLGDFDNGFNEASPLSGDHVYNRLNPALGFTFTPAKSLTAYANYSESSRAPTVIELGCSDPETPCGLPNSFASDPNLQQVVSKSFDVGARGNWKDQLVAWSVDFFHIVNSNDIQFIATSASAGYFNNVGDTRRQGVDVALGGKRGGLSWHLAYSFVDATFQSAFQMGGESNSSANEDGIIQVSPGAHIPLIPRQTGRAVLDYQVNSAWDIGASVLVSSSVYLRGNENNANQAFAVNGQGSEILGTGAVGGYAVANLFSTVHVSRRLDVFVRVNNIFNRKYSTAGFLSSNAFEPNGAFRPDPGTWTNENSIAPAAPLSAWLGIRLSWD